MCPTQKNSERGWNRLITTSADELTLLTHDGISSVFGQDWRSQPLFYVHDDSLRFELGIGDHEIDRFLTAHHRAMMILQDAFRNASDLHLVVELPVDNGWPGVPSLLRCFRGLRVCGLPQPARECVATMRSSSDTERWDCLMIVPIRDFHMKRALWAALGIDLRIEPRVPASVYLLSPGVGILAHPYDDRGMDVIGPNKTRLRELFNTHRSRLLDHDLQKMRRSFA